LRKSIKNKKH